MLRISRVWAAATLMASGGLLYAASWQRWGLDRTKAGARLRRGSPRTVLIVIGIGLAALRSGLDGAVVNPVAPDVIIVLWLLAPPFLFGYLAVLSRSWASGAAAVLLILASPLVASLTYAIGPFDAQPWWEAISGLLTCGAGACVLVAAIRRPARRRDAIVEPAVVI